MDPEPDPSIGFGRRRLLDQGPEIVVIYMFAPGGATKVERVKTAQARRLAVRPADPQQ